MLLALKNFNHSPKLTCNATVKEPSTCRSGVRNGRSKEVPTFEVVMHFSTVEKAWMMEMRKYLQVMTNLITYTIKCTGFPQLSRPSTCKSGVHNGRSKKVPTLGND